MRALIAAVAAAFVVSSAPAANWEAISKAGNGDLVQVDRATIGHSGDLTSIWVQFLNAKIATNGEASVRELYLVDCTARMGAVANYNSYRSDGTVIWSDEPPVYEWKSRLKPIVPDTTGESIMQVACASR